VSAATGLLSAVIKELNIINVIVAWKLQVKGENYETC
jgi:hypothetical protein